MSRKVNKLKLLNITAFMLMIATNIAVQIFQIGGHTTAEISAMYPTLLTPAGFTFSIWMVIYVFLGFFVIQQALGNDDSPTESIGRLFLLSCGLNILWLLCWHFQLIIPATAVIVALWVSILLLCHRVNDRVWYIRGAFDIYYGWITLAAAAQIFVMLSVIFPSVHLEKNAVTIAIIGMMTLTVFGIWMLLMKKNYLFTAALCWGMLGIFASHYGPGYNKMYPSLVMISGTFTAIMILLMLWQLANRRKTHKPAEG